MTRRREPAEEREPHDDTEDQPDDWRRYEEGNEQPVAIDGDTARAEEYPAGVDRR